MGKSPTGNGGSSSGVSLLQQVYLTETDTDISAPHEGPQTIQPWDAVKFTRLLLSDLNALEDFRSMLRNCKGAFSPGALSEPQASTFRAPWFLTDGAKKLSLGFFSTSSFYMRRVLHVLLRVKWTAKEGRECHTTHASTAPFFPNRVVPTLTRTACHLTIPSHPISGDDINIYFVICSTVLALALILPINLAGPEAGVGYVCPGLPKGTKGSEERGGGGHTRGLQSSVFEILQSVHMEAMGHSSVPMSVRRICYAWKCGVVARLSFRVWGLEGRKMGWINDKELKDATRSFGPAGLGSEFNKRFGGE
ncbi:hypothetical protein BDZ94DRAFT_1298851 [Collybia nuda]|uniref:Uncharacterized protein n=1 Tax=Collybia nuda TaxID=64659 RepID=A0A9P5Y5L9_9AGAR|nr:hypothetical protein BDZ94DRAFT_1298851 [Collybia nuda]